MKLIELRDEVFARADWAPSQSPVAKTRVNGFLNAALQRLSRDAPFAFFERHFSFATVPDDLPFDNTTDTVSQAEHAVSGADPWVIRRDTPLALVPAKGLWKVGSGAGRIFATRLGEIWRRHHIREVFVAVWPAAAGGDDQMYEHLALQEPQPSSLYYANTDNWHIYTERYVMPPSVIRLNSMWLHKASETWPLRALTQGQAEKLSLKDIPDQVSRGRPRSFFKWGRFELPTPTQPPVLAVVDSDQWVSGEDAGEPDPSYPPGTFEFCYTYAWGHRDDEFTAGQTIEPLWESAPSPVVQFAALTEAETGTSGAAVTLGFPDIEAIQGFGAYGATPTVRAGHSGWYIRLYVKRLTEVIGDDGGGPASAAYEIYHLDTTEDFFYAGEVPFDETAEAGAYAHFVRFEGYTPIDYQRRLEDSNGNFSYGLYPRPDKRYVMNVRCIERPLKMVDDNDAPPVQEDADDALIDLALHLLAESEERHDTSQLAYGRYRQEHLVALRQVYGPDTTQDTVHSRVPARARQHRRQQRRWWDTTNN